MAPALVDLAAVLTYVRREWGQTGSPVEPAAIRQVRSQVAGRQQPWTNDELEKLLPAPGPGQAPRSGAAAVSES